MAISQNPYVHLETMEETEDKDKKSAKDGSTKGLGILKPRGVGLKHARRAGDAIVRGDIAHRPRPVA